MLKERHATCVARRINEGGVILAFEKIRFGSTFLTFSILSLFPRLRHVCRAASVPKRSSAMMD